MKIDRDGNIYVAGKVYNGKNYDFQVLKYDTDGNLVWASSVADSVNCNNTPTGIYCDTSDNTVHVTGTMVTKDVSYYRFIRYNQCLPSNDRRANPVNENQISFTPSIEFYPNPSNGN